ncbi:hypothetical protein BDV38DRAFT_296828 [Aspergillus pseudotamarii]|uniref:Zn(2)-C6 fungal-type domain-containing protein n=1 Tax=Aspergillus pseudotamarii TaxID=132259 RepID=A0A5N6T4S4_ASPPS|nr:uncharacterized protein BDV38DRAFT_296828 [Aspergillus pseudotamarii]KAE8141313.1 hypothetical protein BDV38DRAFT_296828 [Aspergillus pseudotamarii]
MTPRDVLRRHFRSCKRIGSNPTPSKGKKGRKRKACDACVESRTQCDGELPCETCLQRGLKCTLSRKGEQNGKARHNQDEREKPEDSDINRMPVRFLLNYTNPASRRLYDVQQMLVGCDKDQGKYASFGKAEMCNFDSTTEQWMGLFYLFIDTAALEKSDHDESLMYGLADTVELSHTVSRILGLMKHALKSQFNNKGQFTMKEAGTFFSPTNITLFIKAFFEHSYKNTRFIHKASFNVHTSSAQLLLAMALMGAICVSSQDASSAEGYSDVAEHLIFDGSEFGQVLNTDDPSLTKANMEILQAAMLIAVIQESRDDATIKRRIRVQRFPALVCAARTLRLTQTTNDAVGDTGSFKLDRYFYKESLVRAMAWLYLMDSHLVIYYRNPPQFKVAEACFGLPQDEELYDTMDPSIWVNASQNATSHAPTITLKSVIQRLMERDDTRFEELLSQPCTLFGLFLVLGSLHCMFFDLQALGTCVDLSGPFGSLDVALDRWKKMWDVTYTTARPSDMRQSGFMVHALELWWLGKKLIQKPSTICLDSALSVNSTSIFHQMIRELKGFHPLQ